MWDYILLNDRDILDKSNALYSIVFKAKKSFLKLIERSTYKKPFAYKIVVFRKPIIIKYTIRGIYKNTFQLLLVKKMKRTSGWRHSEL